MAQKKIGIYSELESTPNNKVEDLYLIVDSQGIVFSVKNNFKNEYVAFEYFSNSGDQKGWSQLFAYLQNNSKLMHATFQSVYFVMNDSRVVLSNEHFKEEVFHYQNELNIIHGNKQDEEVYALQVPEKQVVVFGVPDALNILLSRSFPTGKWQHFVNFLLKQTVQDGVYVHLFEQNICLFIVESGKTKLLNYFPIETKDQNSYTILNACVNNGINTNEIPLIVFGFDSNQHDFITMIAPYFKLMDIRKAPDKGIGSNLNNSYPQHTYSNYFVF